MLRGKGSCDCSAWRREGSGRIPPVSCLKGLYSPSYFVVFLFYSGWEWEDPVFPSLEILSV